MDIDKLKDEVDEYVKMIDEICKNEDYNTLTLVITDIINNGSYVIFNSNSKDIVKQAFNLRDGKEFSYIESCVSRKKQMLPNLLNELQK